MGARKRCLGWVECHQFTTGSWCARHTRQRKAVRNAEAARAAEAVAAHRARYGDWCPGWGRGPHRSSDLTADHVTPISKGGAGGKLRVLCRECNGRRRDGAV